ncbi:MAG TPA: rhodanese-like domain-containing protein [Symbiobacteriaceae bacterium]|nr:rhodanese-like domain-containing protein [Symbiobacteriaceae bacterium]
MFALFGPKMESVSTQELQERVERREKLTIVDVREPWEYAEGHIPGSILRPLGQIKTWANEFDKDREILLICRTASRSAAAYKYMRSMGFTNIKNVSGGIITWRGRVAR